MKQIILVICLSFVSFIEGEKYPVTFDIDQDDLNIVYNQLLPFQDKLTVGDNDQVVAILNNYTDQLLPNIFNFSIANQLDPIKLADFSNWFLTASVTLVDGVLGDFSMIKRDGDVKLAYSRQTKVITVTIPIKLDDIYFKYSYHVVLLLIGPWGTMTGRIRDFSMELEISFDFKEYKAKMLEAAVKGSGHIDLTFDGGILEIVINILSELVSTILHPILVVIIQGIVASASGSVVDSINDLIGKILNPQ